MYNCAHIGIARLENSDESKVIISTSPNLCNSFIELERTDYLNLINKILIFGSAFLGFQYLKNKNLLQMEILPDGTINVLNGNNETVNLNKNWFFEFETLIKRKDTNYNNLKVIH